MAFTEYQKQKIKETIIEALEGEAMGLVITACAKAGVSRTVFYEWLKDDEAWAEQVEQAQLKGRQGLVALAEKKLLDNVEAGKEKSIFFVLMNLATKIYGKKQLGFGDTYIDNRKQIILNDPQTIKTLLLTAEIVRRNLQLKSGKDADKK